MKMIYICNKIVCNKIICNNIVKNNIKNNVIISIKIKNNSWNTFKYNLSNKKRF
jgi:hypothetical protein